MRRKLGPLAVAVVAAAVVGLLIYGLTQQGESRALDNAIVAGHPLRAPDVSRSLPVLDRVDASERRDHALARKGRGRELLGEVV